MTKRMRKPLAYLTVGAMVAVGMTSVFATSAVAEDGTSAPLDGVAFEAFAKDALGADEVQVVGEDADGNVVIYTTAPIEEIEDEQIRARVQSLDNVVVKYLDAPLTAYAENEVVGGAGYLAVADPEATSGGLCSVGFTGWSPEGDPAIISAGHCTADGENSLSGRTLPTGDPAGGGAVDNEDVEVIGLLADLAFSQYGGPGNSAGAEDDYSSIDISVWDVANPGLDLLPEVTDWTTAESEDLAASTIPVRSVGQAAVGAEVSKSGRTTGFTSGTVEVVNAWAEVSNRYVYGFMNVLTSDHGDSGGAIIQGDRAVGILSGGGTSQTGVEYTFAADLQNSLSYTDGYTVALYLDAPILTGPADGGEVYTGGTITGTGPADTVLEVTPDSGEPFEVAIDAAGNWAFAAPGEVGPVSYDVVATRGFDSSAVTSFAFDVQLAPLAAPVFTSPANGTSVETELTEITGTGEPGATVELSGAVEGTADVSASGTWSVDAELGYGVYSVTAVQFRAGDEEPSPVAQSDFAVAPVAPVITAPENGGSWAQDAAPKTVTGTGIDGATLEVFVGGTSAGWVVVENGAWSFELTSPLAVGETAITATQTINGATGAAASTTVTITAAAAPAGTPGSSLASTGVSPVLPVAAALLVLLLGAGALIVARRRGALGQRG
ncbi:S1 family peptidase [Agromyces aerolatus]|uniref:S1 family peptidase n=1 Tax=Agromyces sp. LY-1074 TaxID=3074080 RepID=UPI002866A9AF|nr:MULTISPECIES: hypothetical protein [unclassified Agromyces]MDR5700111.1 hypothetical protein [Agromyces sp. LY-1074]MDR5706521.1 hypothetical protein [Agromyces sp. LY-1358]